jgi:hypothetical protein
MKSRANRLFLVILVVFAASQKLDINGIQTLLAIGGNFYNDLFRLVLAKIPLVIGFAWVGMLFSTTTITQRHYISRFALKPVYTAALAVLVVVLSDFAMADATLNLQYSHWYNSIAPLPNYFYWLIISFFLTWLGFKLKLFATKLPAVAFHAVFAQLLLFALLSFS